MRYIDDISGLRLSGTAVTIGKFDGLHIGHQLLLEELKAYKAAGKTTVMLTFDMQPRTLLAGCEIDPVCSWEEKLELLAKNGPDIVIRYPFTRELAAMTPEEFADRILRGELGAAAVVVGDDFRFGCGRSGDAVLLKSLGERFGFETRIIPRLMYGDEPVSSTLIRQLIVGGRQEEADRLLGRSYFD